MKHRLSDIELADEFVCLQPPTMNSAILSRDTGKIYYFSEFGDSDEDIPDDIEDSDSYIALPHKYDLDLGSNLVYDFIQQQAPELSDTVSNIFSRRGAYSRFKGLLRTLDLLDSWYQYEENQTRAALKEWCKENEIDLETEES